MNTTKQILLKSKSGFTLVEMMITISILAIVLALSYQTISYIYDTYQRSEEKNIAQEDVQNVSNWVFTNLRTAYGVDLYADKSKLNFSSTNNHYFFYYEPSDSKIYLRNPGESSGSAIFNVPIEITFSFKTATPKALDFSVWKLKANKELYRQNSTITFPNMLLSSEINQPNKNGNASSPRTSNTVSATGIGTAISFYLADDAGITDLLS